MERSKFARSSRKFRVRGPLHESELRGKAPLPFTSPPLRTGPLSPQAGRGSTSVARENWLPDKLEPSHLGAFVEDLEVALHSVTTDLKRLRLPGPARRQHPDLGSRVFEFRLVRHQNGGAGGSRRGGKFARGIDVSVEMRHVVDEVELGTARERY